MSTAAATVGFLARRRRWHGQLPGHLVVIGQRLTV
jgi:hypothetical protein